MDCAVTSNISIEIKPKEEKKRIPFLICQFLKGFETTLVFTRQTQVCVTILLITVVITK